MKDENNNKNAIKWGVGQKNNEPVSDFLTLDDFSAKEKPAPYEEIETLDEDFTLPELTKKSVSEETEINQVTEMPIPKITPVEQPTPKIIPVEQPTPKSVPVPPPVTPFINNEQNPNWMNNQPLSTSSLGVTSISQDNKPHDVSSSNKFFNKDFQTNQKSPSLPSHPIKKKLGIEEEYPDINETELLKNYVSHHFTKINMSIFSFKAFLFKGAYLINLKEYLLGIIIMAIESYILLFLPLKTSLIAYGILSIVLGFIANPLYIKIAKIKVHLLHIRKKNRPKKQNELNKICASHGGQVTLIALLCECIFLGGIIYLSFNKYPNSTLKESYKIVNNYLEERKKPTYDGVIDRLSINIDSLINISIPEEFKAIDSKILKYSYSPEGNEEIKTCSLSISKINKFKDPLDFINQYKKVEKLNIDYTTINNNGLTWYSLTEPTKAYDRTLNVTDINGSVILFEYNSGYEVEEGLCQNYYNKIFNSISLK